MKCLACMEAEVNRVKEELSQRDKLLSEGNEGRTNFLCGKCRGCDNGD